MTRLFASLAILVISTSGMGPSHASIAQQEREREAHQPRFRPGIPILSQVRPDELVVEVLKDAPPDIGITANAEEEIEALTRMSDAVAIVRVVSKQSAFTTKHTPPYRVPGDWITSIVAARVTTVLKDPVSRLTEGGLVSISEDGGVVEVEGRRVIARNPYELQTQVGRSYLVFFWVSEGALQPLGPSWTFEVSGQQLQRLRTDIHPEWELDRKTPEWAESQVRAMAHLPKRNRGAQ